MSDLPEPTTSEVIAMLPESISKDLDQAQELADIHDPILADCFADIFNRIKLKLSIIKES